MDLRQLRDKATDAFKRGRFARSGELYAEYCAKDPKDLQARLRMGDAWVKAGDRGRAVEAYRSAAEAFAREGFLPRAIAAAKLVLEQDPAHQGIQQLLAELYAQRSGPARPAPAPLPVDDDALEDELDDDAADGAPKAEGERAAPAAPAERALPDPGDLPPELDPALTSSAALAPAAPPEQTFQFDELSLDDAGVHGLAAADSLLHAVMAAAEAANPEPAPEQDEEEVFSIEVSTAETPALPKIPLFSDLPADAFIALVESCGLRRFADGEQVIAQGSVGDAFYVVCEGAVRVLRELSPGQVQELTTLGPGEFFGEMALLSGAPRSASVHSASDETQLLEISAGILAGLSSRHPQIAAALKRFCRQRMLANVMASSPLFQPFSTSERRDLVQRFRARDFPGGQVLIHEGREADGLYVVLSGEVEVMAGGQRLARLQEGELFGEMSLLRKGPASATVRTSRKTSLIRLPRQDFDELILSHPQILVLVAELTDTRARRAQSAVP
jgi:CRP-like cAMP-binding protein